MGPRMGVLKTMPPLGGTQKAAHLNWDFCFLRSYFFLYILMFDANSCNFFCLVFRYLLRLPYVDHNRIGVYGKVVYWFVNVIKNNLPDESSLFSKLLLFSRPMEDLFHLSFSSLTTPCLNVASQLHQSLTGNFTVRRNKIPANKLRTLPHIKHYS